MAVRGPADGVSPLSHHHQAMSIRQGEILIAELAKHHPGPRQFIRRAVREQLPAPGEGAWMKYAGFVATGDPRSSQSVDEIVYGTKD